MSQNVPKHLLKFFFKYFLFFFTISWALEALGPLPNCRSHFSDQDGINESSRNLQNTSFMTKQCSNPKPVFCVFLYCYHWIQPIHGFFWVHNDIGARYSLRDSFIWQFLFPKILKSDFGPRYSFKKCHYFRALCIKSQKIIGNQRKSETIENYWRS